MTDYLIERGNIFNETDLVPGVIMSDVDARDPQGRTPLWWAVLSNNQPVGLSLLAHGADPTVEDHEQWAPIDLAAHYHRAEWIPLLLGFAEPKMETGGHLVGSRVGQTS